MPQNSGGLEQRGHRECLLKTEKTAGVVEEEWGHEMLWKRLGVVPTVKLTFKHCGDLQSRGWVCGGGPADSGCGCFCPGWALGPGPWDRLCACVSLTFPTPHPQKSPLSATPHSCIWALVTSSSSLCPCPSVHSDLAPTSLVHGDRSLPAYQSERLNRAVQCPPASSWLPSHLPALLLSFSRPRPCSPQPLPASLPVLRAATLILLAHSQAL